MTTTRTVPTGTARTELLRSRLIYLDQLDLVVQNLVGVTLLVPAERLGTSFLVRVSSYLPLHAEREVNPHRP